LCAKSVAPPWIAELPQGDVTPEGVSPGNVVLILAAVAAMMAVVMVTVAG
jgi:hypothetical protein